MAIIAIIPARGASKRIPGKNARDFLGRPIIAYSIEAALHAKCFDEVMVSTDDKEIAAIAKQEGASVPFYRSQTNSGDFATTSDVIEEVLLEYKKMNKIFQYCCCIYPAAPFITADYLKLGRGILQKARCDSVMPVVRFSYPIQRALKIVGGRLCMLWPENINTRSQDLIPAYHDAGQFYWLNVESFMKQRNLFMEHTVPLEIPESESQDIDNEEDWKIAEIKYRMLKKSK